MQTLQIISLCTALFSPGIDSPLEESRLRMTTPVRATVAHEACVTTARQAVIQGVDPFVSIAAVYYTTRMDSKSTRKSRLYRRMRTIWDCPGLSRYSEGKCDPFVLAPKQLRSHLLSTAEEDAWITSPGVDYSRAVCKFLNSRGNCASGYIRPASRVRELATKFAEAYAQNHPDFKWDNPYLKETGTVRLQRDYLLPEEVQIFTKVSNPCKAPEGKGNLRRKRPRGIRTVQSR